MRALLVLFCALTFSSAAPAAEVRRFSDAELMDGFLRTVFGAEYNAPADAVLVVKKFLVPVRVRIEALPSENFPPPAAERRRREAEGIIRALAARVPGARIGLAARPRQANVLLVITDRRNYVPVGQALLSGQADFMRRTICAGVPSWHPNYALERALAIVPGDVDDRQFASCVAEEVLQVLGAVNDDNSLIHSTFNDRNGLGGFPLFDQMILNMLYDPRIRPGMRAAQARAILPRVIADVRPRVEAAANRRAGPDGRVGFATSGFVFE